MVSRRKDRETGKYRVRRSVGGIRYEASFTLKEDADRYEAKLMREKELIRAGLGSPQDQILIIDYSDTWMAKREKEKNRPTWEPDEKNLRLYILPYMAKRPLSTVSTVEWKKLFEFVCEKEDLSPATHNRIRSTAHTLYADAVADGLVTINPVAGVPRKSEKKKTRRTAFWQTDEEIETFLNVASQQPIAFKLFAYLALNTGMRVGEACAVEWRDCEFDYKRRKGVIFLCKIYEQVSGEIQPRTKSGEGEDRYVPIMPTLFDVLIAHKGVSTDRIVGLTPDQVARMQDRVIATTNLPRVTPHGLRKTFATWYRRHKGSKDDLQTILGHSSPMVTDVYAKTTKASVTDMGLEGVGALQTHGKNVVPLRGSGK